MIYSEKASYNVMAKDLLREYENIAEATRLVRAKSLDDLAPIQAAHELMEDVQLWQEVLKDRPEAVVFDQIVSTLELGLFSLVSGLYRQAYGSLRLAVELVAALSWFSTHRLDLAEWQAGERDLIWREITNQEEGILSPRYRKAFFPELNEEKRYNGLYQKLYRELSEHVHGNASTWTGPDNIKFDKSLHDGWLDKLQTFIFVMNVLLSLRYLQEVSVDNVGRLNPTLCERVPQVAAIKRCLDERLAAATSQVTAVSAPPSGTTVHVVRVPLDVSGSEATPRVAVDTTAEEQG